jgi:hypothetical protein
MTPLCGAKARSNGNKPCRRFAGPNGRCSNHGGRSTGPRSVEGKKRQKKAVLKHGYWSKEACAERNLTYQLIRDMQTALRS